MGPWLLLLLLLLVQGAPPPPGTGLLAPHPRQAPANATVFSHIYSIRRGAAEGARGAGPESPQEVLAPPSQQQPPRLYEHTLEGDEKVVFTHRINLPPPACDCEGGGDGGALREALSRLQALETQVQALQEQCGAKGCCPSSATAQAGTGQTDTQSLCSRHGTFNLATCGCVCQPGWGGPTCAEPQCPGGCGGRGECVAGRCVCPSGFAGARCETPVCADDCNDQGRCEGGRCVCFPGYSGPACEMPDCPGDCHGHGRCQDGRCVCRPGYAGPDCSTRGCPGDCSGRGRCLKNGACACRRGYAGPDCSQPACPGDCGGHGECRLGECHCQEGYAGEDCTMEIPAVTLRVGHRDEGSFRLQWTRPKIHVDGYEIHLVPTGDPEGAESLQLPGSATSFERSGLDPGQEFSVTVRAQRDQRLGPPATQSVRTRIDAPRDLRPTGATATSLSLRWEPPAAGPDRYTLRYGPAGRDSTEPPTRLVLPPDRTTLTLTGLRSTTLYTLTLTAHRGPEQSPPASASASTAPMPTLPLPGRPHPEPTRPPVPRLRPPGPVGKPGPRPTPANASSVPSQLFFRTMTQNLTAKLSRYNGTLLQRLESYLRATRYPLRGNQTIATVAKVIYHYLVQRKSLEEQEMVYVGLGQHSKELGAMAPTPGYPMEQPTGPPGQFQKVGEVGSIFSEGSPGLDTGPRGHAKPVVVARSPGAIVVSLEGMRGHAERMVVRYWRVGDGGGVGELAVPGDARAIRLHGLMPGTTYQVEIHGLVQGRLSKSYSFVTSTAPEASGTEQPPETPMSSLSRPGPPPGDLAVTDVSPDRFRVTWTATTGPFQHFLLRYREPGSVVPPGQTQVPGGKRSVIVTQLSPGTEYEVELRGVAPDGTISEPITTSVWTAPLGRGPGPNELGVLGVRNVTSDGFGLQWRARKGLFQSFLLRYEDASGRMGPWEAEVPADQRATRVGGLQPGAEYNVTLYGVHRGQLSPPLRARVWTAPAEPAPQLSLGELSASDVTHDSTLLSWTVQAGDFDSFLLQYKDAEGKPQALPVDGGSRTVTVANLAPSRRYKFNLYGISGRKRLGPVSTDTVTAAAPREEEPTPQPSLGELSASNVTHDSALLSWTVQAGDFDSFLLQYKDTQGNPQALPVDGGSRTVTVAKLAPSRRYKFNLYGISGRKRLGPVSTNTVTAAAPREEEPTPQPSLGELSASNITHDSALLSWTVQAGDFDSFLLQYKDAEGNPQALPMDGGSRTVTVANLAPSHRYKFNLYGISGRKRLGPVSTDTVTAAAPREEEPVPQPNLGELSASDVTHNSILLSWTVQAGDFDSFLLQYKDAEGNPQALPVDGGSRTVTVANLAPTRRYKFNLYGISGRKRLGPVSTNAVTAVAPREEEPAPQPSLGELSASDVTHDSALLSWTVQAGTFDSFLLQYKDTEGKPQALPVDGGSLTVTITNLVPSHRYKFHLYGISGHKHLGPISTDAVTATAPRVEEPAPQPSLGELSASDVTHDSIPLSWTVEEGTFDSFLLQYKDAEGNPQALPVDGGSRTVTVGNLAPSRRYKFNLYGISGRKRLGPVSTDAVTAVAPREEEPAPQPSLGELSASDVTHDSALLSWTVQAGDFDSFLLQYKDAKGKPQALPMDRGSRTVTVTNLAPSRRYKFNLYGTSGRKRLGPVSTDAVTAAAPRKEEPAPQPSLRELSASNVTHDSILLSWTVQAGDFDSFLLQYKDAEGKPQALPVDGASRTVTVTNLAPSCRYKFNLYGVSGHKRLGPVSTDAITAAAPREEEPTPQPSLGELSASNVTHNSALLSWTVQAGDFDSFLLQYKDAEGNPQALPVDGGSRTVTITNLVPSRRYKFNLYGISGRKRLGPVSTDTVTAVVPREEGVGTQLRLGVLSVANAAHNSLDLSWTVEGTFDSFILQYRDAEGNPRALPVDGALHSLHLHDLAPSHRYKFNLYGVSGRKRLGPVSTNAITAAVPREEDPALQPNLGELSASNITHDSALLSWTVQAGTFDSFLLQYKDAEGNPQVLPVDGGSRMVTVANLAPSHRYKFNFYGVSGHKRLGPVSTDAVTDAVPREEVPALQPSLGELSASNVTYNSALLSWTVQAGDFDSFLLQYKDAKGKPQALPVDGGSRTVTVTNLTPSRRYKFNLYGISGRKRLGPVSTDAVTAAVPREEEPAPQPNLGELSASNVTHDSIPLSWTVEEGTFDSFLLQYKDAEGKPQALPMDGASRTVTVANLAPSRRYKFNLYGISGRKRLGPVSTDAVTAVAPREEEPTPQPSLGELSASSVTHDSALLSWTIQAGDFDSFLLQYKDAEGKPQALPMDGGSRTVTVANLAPSRRYKFNLYGISGRKRLGPVSTDTVTAVAPREEEPAPQPSLGELSASDVTHDSALLSWTVQAGTFDSFLLQYKDAEGNPQALPVDGGSRTVTITNLVPSRRYKFNLYGISGHKRLGPVSTDTVTAAGPREEEPTPQPSLGELSASNITHNSALLSWTVEGTFDSFLLQYKDVEGKPQALPMDGGSRTVTITNLVPSRRYKFKLYGVSARKRLGPVSTDAVTAPGKEEPASRPSLGELSASDITHDSILLSWTVEGTFASFLLQYKDAEGKPHALPVDGGSRTVTVTNLAPSRRYKFNLYGISGRKRLGPVSTDAVTAVAPREEEPTPQPNLGELSASDVTHDSIPLSWTVEGTFDSFLIQYKDAEGKPQALPVDGGSRTVTVTNLAPSRRYKFNLYGVSGRKRLGPVSTDAVTAAALREEEPAPQPSLGELSASNVTHDSALLSWTIQAGDFDSFLLQYKDMEGNPQALPVDGGSRTVTITNLVPSRRYKFNLYGVSGRKRLGPVSTDTVTAMAPREKEPTPQPSLGELTASNVTHDSALLSWTVQAGDLDSFLLQYKDTEGKPQVLPVDGASRTVTVTNLAPSRRYKFNLYGISGRKRLGPVSTDAVTATAPQEEGAGTQRRLGELSASGVTHDSALLSWTVQAGDFDSFLLQYKDAEGKAQALPVDGRSRTVTVANLAPSRRYKFNLYGISGRMRLGPVSTDAVTAAVPREEEPAPQPSLGELLASDITHDSALLSWTVQAGTFDSFLLQYKDAEGKPQVLPVDGGSRTVTVANLAPSRRYKFNLYGISGRKRLGPVSTDTVTVPREEGARIRLHLGQLSASDVTHDSLDLSWTVEEGTFDSFILQYRDADGNPQALPVDGGSRTVTIANLAPSRRYKFNLYGISGRKRLGPISTNAVTGRQEEEDEEEDEGATQPKLGELSTSEVTKDSVRLSWTVQAGAFDSFLLQYRDAEGNPQVQPADGASRTLVVSDLLPSRKYKFNLYGVSGPKRLGPVSTDAVTAFPEASSVTAAWLDQLLISEVTPTSLRLSWDAPEGNFDTFLIRYRDAGRGSGLGPAPAQEVPVPGAQRSAVLHGLRPGTEYSLAVYGLQQGEETANIRGAAQTSSLELESPRDLRFNDVRETSVGVTWGAPSTHVDHYKVSFQLSDGGEPQSVMVEGTRLPTTLEGLIPGASYEVSVMAIRGFEESEPLVGYVTTVPDGPSDLRAVNITNTSALLHWRPPRAPVHSYELSYGPPEGPSVTVRLPGTQAQHPLSGLQLDTEYLVSIHGVTGGNRSSPTHATFTTGLDAPRDLQATDVTPRSARLSWTPPRVPPAGYLLSYETPSGQTQEIPLGSDAASYQLSNLTPSSRYQVRVQAIRGGLPSTPIATSFNTVWLTYPFPRDCVEEQLNGPGPSREVTIYLGGDRQRPLQVYCDMETDGGGWLVFQRRMNGETDFWRDWQDYARGFGNLSREFWLGNDALHQLTAAAEQELWVDLRAGTEAAYARYQRFRVDPPSEHYRLHLDGYRGTAGDALSYHSGSVFSTRDRDPNRLLIPCAVSYRGAWWYRNCHYANLNGLYSSRQDHQGVNWFNWKGFEFSIPFTEMKLRPRRG
ncbi:tenascin-X [Dermochelys coriacea]|uniref:tenascin-X n=1 Tax=Dermochelys coriacea TaxID=27794 RepID=UPI001CA9046A|nr:tenascin-X [Dermochelys coriacea]